MLNNELNQKIEYVYKQIGEFGPYQFLIFVLAGTSTFIPAIVGFGPSFYAAVPSFRCKIPHLENDTYEIANSYHQRLVDKYIFPSSKETSFKDIYDRCNLRVFGDDSDNSSTHNGIFKPEKCNSWVFSKK